MCTSRSRSAWPSTTVSRWWRRRASTTAWCRPAPGKGRASTSKRPAKSCAAGKLEKWRLRAPGFIPTNRRRASAIRPTALRPPVSTGRCGWGHRPNVDSIRTASACTPTPIPIFGGSGITPAARSPTRACTCWTFCKWRSMRRCRKRLPRLAENSGSRTIARRRIRCR